MMFEEIQEHNEFKRELSMDDHDTKLQQVQEALERLSARVFRVEEIQEHNEFKREPSMDDHDTKLQQVQEALERVSARVSCVEEIQEHNEFKREPSMDDHDTKLQQVHQEALERLLVRLSRVEEILEQNEFKKEPSMDDHHTKLQQVHQEALERLSARVSRVEDSIVSPLERFSPSYFQEMTSSLSMPGWRFIGRRFQHSIHSYLWLFIHMVALLVSYNYIKDEYDNWQTSPVIRTLSNNLTFVREIPFPAVTVCAPYSINKDYDYLKDLQKCFVCNTTAGGDNPCFFNSECDRGEMEVITIASLICANNLKNVLENPHDVYVRDISDKINGQYFSKHAKKVFPACDFYILYHQGRGFVQEVKEVLYGCDQNGFQHFLRFGPYGFCTTVNGLRHEDIFKENTVVSIPIQPKSFDKSYIGGDLTLENMIYFNGSSSSVPAYFGEDDYFAFYISERKNQMYRNVCNSLSSDIVASVVFHNPAEIPLYEQEYEEHTVKANKYHEFKVIPKLVTTKIDLIGYSPIQRGCFYSHERELMLYKYYTQVNCEKECEVNCSLKFCNCVPFYLPRPNISVQICLSGCEASCGKCGCLPDCVSLSYEVETKEKEKQKDGLETHGLGVVVVLYKRTRKSFYPMTRVAINDLADFMAYSFGILGIFNGFSIMVIFEVFYFMTVRLWSSVKALLTQNID